MFRYYILYWCILPVKITGRAYNTYNLIEDFDEKRKKSTFRASYIKCNKCLLFI